MVITDYDLTKGVKGFFGLSIVAWCQNRSIPVGEFSRGDMVELPKDPNLFELRVPSSEADAATFIANAFMGFRKIRTTLESTPTLLDEGKSLATVLAAILGRKNLSSQLALYMSRLGAANSGLLRKLRAFAGEEVPDQEDKIRLLTYVLGHVLLNAILKYPGPILSERALCAYVATSHCEFAAIADVFDEAQYKGPFSDTARYYWRKEVDARIEALGEKIELDNSASFADLNRAVLEAKLERKLAAHECTRCAGVKGGFWCPFTIRPVCERSDCSVPSSSWIPQGAQLCRVERDFYDEWAPLLGL